VGQDPFGSDGIICVSFPFTDFRVSGGNLLFSRVSSKIA
jgi:hypothetical protein